MFSVISFFKFYFYSSCLISPIIGCSNITLYFKFPFPNSTLDQECTILSNFTTGYNGSTGLLSQLNVRRMVLIINYDDQYITSIKYIHLTTVWVSVNGTSSSKFEYYFNENSTNINTVITCCYNGSNLVYLGFNYSVFECNTKYSLQNTPTTQTKTISTCLAIKSSTVSTSVSFSTQTSSTELFHSSPTTSNTTTVSKINVSSVSYSESPISSTQSGLSLITTTFMINNAKKITTWITETTGEVDSNCSLWYTVKCTIKKTRFNQLNSSQIDILFSDITDLGLCDLLIKNYTLLKMMIYKNITAVKLTTMKNNLENRLKEIDVEYSLIIKSSKSFAYLAIISITVVVLCFIFDDLKNLLKFIHRKYLIGIERRKNLAKKNYNLPKNDFKLDELTDFRKVKHLDMILFEKSRKLKNRIQIQNSVV